MFFLFLLDLVRLRYFANTPAAQLPYILARRFVAAIRARSARSSTNDTTTSADTVATMLDDSNSANRSSGSTNSVKQQQQQQLSTSAVSSASSSSSSSDNASARSAGSIEAATSAALANGSGADLTSKMIVFKADDKQCSFETNQRSVVTVVGSAGNHESGSSKVKLKSIVDYKWDLRHYPGRLITVHIDGKHLAYAILVRTNEGMVRVVNPSNGHRALIKGMTTEVLDLQFAHIRNLMVLASIEETALHLHKIDSLADKILCTMLLKIVDTHVPAPGTLHRLNWCPYVPEKETEIDEYISQQLVWVRGPLFRCYSVRSVVNMYGVGSRLTADTVEGTLSNRKTLSQSWAQTQITGASFSPDGSTLCVSGMDGMIRFYQVYFHTNEPTPRCLHQWTPHDGRPISSFFFLDNLTKFSKDKSLWRHAITACNDNTEIKVWCCSDWKCLQTVHFRSPLGGAPMQLHAQIDRTSSYLVLSDSRHRGLYVLQVQIDAGGSPPRNHAEAMLSKRLRSSQNSLPGDGAPNDGAPSEGGAASTSADNSLNASNASSSVSSNSNNNASGTTTSVAYIKSISEFPMGSSILSYHIVDAAVRRYKCAFNDSYLLEELDDYDEENHSLYCVVLNMYLVQPKSVQECHVLYQPTVDGVADVRSSMELLNDTAAAAVAVESAATSANVSVTEAPEPETVPSSTDATIVTAGEASVNTSTADVGTNDLSSKSTPAAAAAPAVAEVQTTVATPITLEALMAAVPSSLQTLEAKQKTAGLVGLAPQKVAVRSPGTINLMTPDSFQSPRGRETPDGVSSDVRSALQMLATQTGQQQQQQQVPPSSDESPASQSSQRKASVGADAKPNVLSLAAAGAVVPVAAGAAAAARAADAESAGLGLDAMNVAGPATDAEAVISGRQSVEINNQILAPECGASLLAAAAAVASGGSSPSREVQEILSPKGSDRINDYYDDSTDLSDDNDVDSVPGKKNLGDQYNFNEPNSKESHDKKAWPKVPVVPPGSMSNLHCANFNNINASSSSNAAAAVAATATIDTAAIAELSNKMDQMLEFMQAQSCQIAELRNTAAAERKRADEAHALSLQQSEKRLAKAYEEHLARAKREHLQRMEEQKKQHLTLAVEFRNQIVQVVCSQVCERTAAVLMGELQQRIVPLIISRLDQIKLQIQSEVAQKLSICDQLLRDNIARVCTSKQTMEVFGNAVLLGVQASLQKTYADTMRGTLIPAYEKASGEMFKQVQDVFVNGTKAYSKLFETYFAQYEPVQDNLNALVAGLPEHMKVASDTAIATYTAKLTVDLQRDLKAMQAQLLQTVRDNVKNEIKKGFEAQTATIEDSVRSVVRSESQTPAPPSVFDYQEQIRSLLAQNQVNSAFHQALVANDLSLVEYLIEKADLAVVFNPCPLQQTVLLSLIQQLSADMSNHTALKQRYIAEAILNLNKRDATTKEHAPKVLRELFVHCHAYTEKNPTSLHNSGLRVLMMAVQGLGIEMC